MNAFIKKIQNEYEEYDAARSEIIKLSAKAQKCAKKTIFALHRDNIEQAKESLAESQATFALISTNVIDKIPNITREGSYRAAIEEYVEAYLFYTYIVENQLAQLDESHQIPIQGTDYLAGLADFTGELVRKSTLLATNGEYEKINQYYAMLQSITEHLLEFNLTGHLRSKFDQVKRNLKSIEQIQYDISIKKG